MQHLWMELDSEWKDAKGIFSDCVVGKGEIKNWILSEQPEKTKDCSENMKFS